MLVRLFYIFITLMCLNVPATMADSHGESEEVSTGGSGFEVYDGGWQFGLGLELTEIQELNTDDFRWGIIIGKDFYQNEDISVGFQLHFANSFFDDIDDDEATMDSTNLFVTSHFKGFPPLKFKLGTSYTRTETNAGNDSDTGMVYGLDLALGGNKIYHTLLSYEDSLSGPDYRSLFINIAFFFAPVYR